MVFQLDAHRFVFEDTRYFGRLTLETTGIEALGPEPLSADFALKPFIEALARSAQPIKVKLLDQSIVAGIGNIYASEALFRARISPQLAARRLDPQQAKRLLSSIRETLNRAITVGSTVPLDYSRVSGRDALFYYGTSLEASARYHERLQVYDREGLPCFRCGDSDSPHRPGDPKHFFLSRLPIQHKIQRRIRLTVHARTCKLRVRLGPSSSLGGSDCGAPLSHSKKFWVPE